ncbi:hypothetical protein AVEN_216850-1 [Araneus ventricosus]|uniref:Uncharacterized protein n=1 Tax=Araneus ventricosus TaxID=182803 RepID=A0A4Y2TM08_ARAVE|nr:hypothetical protein AVEN_216850-1 [Araneus ventricosus]
MVLRKSSVSTDEKNYNLSVHSSKLQDNLNSSRMHKEPHKSCSLIHRHPNDGPIPCMKSAPHRRENSTLSTLGNFEGLKGKDPLPETRRIKAKWICLLSERRVLIDDDSEDKICICYISSHLLLSGTNTLRIDLSDKESRIKCIGNTFEED